MLPGPNRYSVAGALPPGAADFLVPAALGTMAGVVAGVITRKLMDGTPDSTKDAASYLVNSGVFLIVGGLAFVFRKHQPR